MLQLASRTVAVVVQLVVLRFFFLFLPTGSATVAAITTTWPITMPLSEMGTVKSAST